jgi:5-formyltetrahydrofolate cyclo-ligase
MIFDSLGIGELGLVAVVAVLFLDPKKVGEAGRAFARLRRKWSEIQREVKQQIDTAMDENPKETPADIRAAKTALRREGKNAVQALTSLERAQAAEKILERLKDWAVFREAKVVAAFAGTHEELDTEPVLRHVLAAGKILLLPFIEAPGGNSRVALAEVKNREQDLREGAFGILEPREELRGAAAPIPDLILVPGLVFDECGGRLGRGRGFYDRFLKQCPAFKASLAFEAQILRKKLVLEAHDQLLDALVTERKLRVFPRTGVVPSSGEKKG